MTFPPAGPRPVARVEAESGGTATVSWSDAGCPSQGSYVQQVNNGPIQTVSDSARRLTVISVTPGTGYTILIGAIYEVGVPPAWSAPVCVAGCYQGPASAPSTTAPPGSGALVP